MGWLSFVIAPALQLWDETATPLGPSKVMLMVKGPEMLPIVMVSSWCDRGRRKTG